MCEAGSFDVSHVPPDDPRVFWTTRSFEHVSGVRKNLGDFDAHVYNILPEITEMIE